MLLLLRKWPIAGLCAKGLFKRGLWCKVGNLVDGIFVFGLQNDLAKIELAMHKAIIVGKVETLCQLDGDIIDSLDVGAGHIDCQVEIQTLNVIEDVASIVVLNH